MSTPKHDPPMHRPQFVIGEDLPFFAVRARQDGDPAAGYDVLDEYGDAIGFFRQAVDGTVSVHGPYGLDATGGPGLDLHQDGRPVMGLGVGPGAGTVTIPDPRVDVRLAAAIVAALEAPTGEH